MFDQDQYNIEDDITPFEKAGLVFMCCMAFITVILVLGILFGVIKI